MVEEGSPVPASVDRLAQIAQHRLGAMSDVQQARGLHDAMAGFAGVSARTRFSPRWWAWRGAAVGALAVCALLIGPRFLRQQPLTYAMSHGEMQAGGYFRAGAVDGSRLQFSDGTQVDLRAGARGRVASVDTHGARVMLDEGEADVRVTPRPGAQWWFDAGPFVVQVRGTEFALAWRGAEGRLDVRLRQGAITVSGPLSEQPIVLRPGQWLTVRLASHEVFVRDFNLDQPPPLTSEPAPAPSEAVPPPTIAPSVGPAPAATRPRHAAAAHASPAASDNRESAWGPARADGDWQRILDAATKRGVDRTIAERSSEDLALLADAAHYLHHDDVAQQSLLAQRRRFAGSTRAKDAAFLLGRIVEGRPNGAAEALGWYDRHLAEAPDGPYASEALGRKMTLLARVQGDAAARPIAEEYLRRYPSGSYARAARAYASQP
jgi:TolA-binding protein